MTPPWNDGPAELIGHALQLLAADTPASRRLALIAADEALRVTVRSYLDQSVRSDQGWRLVPLIPTRRRIEATESIPVLLELLDDVAQETHRPPANLEGVERLHRLRMDAFRDGRGVEVPAHAVETYAALVEALHLHLFDSGLTLPNDLRSNRQRALADFLQAWATVDDEVRFLVTAETDLLWDRRRHPTDVSAMVQALRDRGVITAQAALGVREMWALRWALAHAAEPVDSNAIQHATRDTAAVLAELRRATEAVEPDSDGYEDPE